MLITNPDWHLSGCFCHHQSDYRIYLGVNIFRDNNFRGKHFLGNFWDINLWRSTIGLDKNFWGSKIPFTIKTHIFFTPFMKREVKVRITLFLWWPPYASVKTLHIYVTTILSVTTLHICDLLTKLGPPQISVTILISA